MYGKCVSISKEETVHLLWLDFDFVALFRVSSNVFNGYIYPPVCLDLVFVALNKIPPNIFNAFSRRTFHL